MAMLAAVTVSTIPRYNSWHVVAGIFFKPIIGGDTIIAAITAHAFFLPSLTFGKQFRV